MPFLITDLAPITSVDGHGKQDQSEYHANRSTICGVALADVKFKNGVNVFDVHPVLDTHSTHTCHYDDFTLRVLYRCYISVYFKCAIFVI